MAKAWRANWMWSATGLALVLLGFATPAAAWNDTSAPRIRAAIERFMRPSGEAVRVVPPALSVAIGGDGDVLMAEGFGFARDGVPATADTIYRAGSITKQMTAAAALHLLENGAVSARDGHVLSLESPVSDVLDHVEAWQDPGQLPITLRSLLTMTSNLPNFTRRPPQGLDPWGAVMATDLLTELKKARPVGWPGSFEYSNTSYFLLAAVVEGMRLPGAQATQSYREVVRQRIFRRAQMRTAHFIDEPAPDGSVVAQPTYRRKPAFNTSDWLKGSGDVVASALDVWSWNRALMAGDVLSRSTVGLMFQEHARVAPVTYYGMGWFISDINGWPLAFHTGTVPGYTAVNAILRAPAAPRWLSVTLMCNSDGIEGLEVLAEDLLRIASQE